MKIMGGKCKTVAQKVHFALGHRGQLPAAGLSSFLAPSKVKKIIKNIFSQKIIFFVPEVVRTGRNRSSLMKKVSFKTKNFFLSSVGQ